MEIDFETGQMDFKNYQADTRFDVPRNLTKKEYTSILKDTQKKIYDLKKIIQQDDDVFPERVIALADWEDYIIKKEKLKKILAFHKGFKKEIIDIQKAKDHPIDDLLEFNPIGFISCIFHGPEHTPSMKYYKEKNRVHCFGCGKNADSIDVYQKLYNVDFVTAVKKLL